MISRRDFPFAMIAGAPTSVISTREMAVAPPPVKARNVVLVHCLFADGSCCAVTART